MRQQVLMPRLSDEVEEGVVVTWFVQPGATVAEGDLLAEVQVEKISADVHAPAAGRVVELLVQPGGVVRQGAPIATLEEAAAETAAGPATSMTSPATVTPAGPAVPTAPPASPSARRLARELDVDLSSVVGSGPGGRIVEADVRGAASAPAAGARIEPITPMRRTVADRLSAGLAETAQLTLTAEADVTELAAELERVPAASGRRASYTEAVVRACALALRNHPRLAARWSEEGLVLPQTIDIGVAVALAEGLVVPVVRAADGKGLEALGREIAGLAERARAGRLDPGETEGGVFTVTSLGGYRIDAFTPLLNLPETAILGVGRARERPAVVGGKVVPRTLVVLSLTFDHRVVDGLPAAACLEEVARLLEDPSALIAE